MYVTVALADLRSGLGAATTLGPAGDPSILGADTARRLACDAGIIPVVLGDRGEILDYGRERRLVPLPMRKLLWLRDRHCTFPGCDLPAWFCDAHHIEHWADGGATTAENTALLCARHHTIVHRDGLTATIDAAGRVCWQIVQQGPRRVAGVTCAVVSEPDPRSAPLAQDVCVATSAGWPAQGPADGTHDPDGQERRQSKQNARHEVGREWLGSRRSLGRDGVGPSQAREGADPGRAVPRPDKAQEHP